jgi:hypothetical protein
MALELLVQNPLRIANNQQNTANNFHQDIMESMQSYSFQGQANCGLSGNTKGGSITVLLTSSLPSLESAV